MRPSLLRRNPRRRPPRFESLPKHAQRDLYRAARALVRERGFAGRVYAYEAIAEDDGSPRVDFVFVGDRSPLVYQGTAMTIEDAARDGVVEPRPHARLVPHYAFGIGLEVFLDVPSITPSVLVDFVDRFLAAGPTPDAPPVAARGGFST